MAYELLTVLLGECAGAALMLYLAFGPTYGQKKNSLSTTSPPTTYAPSMERAIEVAEAPVAVSSAPSPASEPAPEPAPAPAPAMYETVQPAPAPVTYAAPSSTSFGAPTLSKPTRTYRRRTAPVRSAAAPKKTLAAKRKKS